MAAVRKKLTIIGDGCSGKTNLIYRLVNNIFPSTERQADIKKYTSDIDYEGQQVKLSIWDTIGNEDCDRIRPVAYPDTDVLIILFSIGVPWSLDNVFEKWIREVLHFLPKVPIILVGGQRDLRNDAETRSELSKRGEEPVSYEQGNAMAEKIGATAYMECSAKADEGVKEVFEAAAIAALLPKQKKKKKWLSFGLF